MKAYTDLKQSKKLADILPLESADMFFQLGEDKYADSIRVPLTKEHWEQMMPNIKPCWSLAALLNALPNDCGVNKEEDKFVASYIILDECGDYTSDNPIDACYEMILYLYELHLL